MKSGEAALIELVRALRDEGYAFVTVSPETHRRVDARAAARGGAIGTSLRDAFGWSRPFRPASIPARVLELARAADVLTEDGELLRSRIRVSSLGGQLYVHSAYPTLAEDSVFFGPDTYRYCALVEQELARGPRAKRLVDVGCGSGVGGIAAAAGAHVDAAVLADINPSALRLAEVNAALAGVTAEIVSSDVLAGVTGDFDVVISNPPYMADPDSRTYRDGGGDFGEALAARIAREAITRLRPGGRLILYTGAAIVDGTDTFRRAVAPICEEANVAFGYREIDPDVFGDEIEHNDAYALVERIAAVALVATVR